MGVLLFHQEMKASFNTEEDSLLNGNCRSGLSVPHGPVDDDGLSFGRNIQKYIARTLQRDESWPMGTHSNLLPAHDGRVVYFASRSQFCEQGSPEASPRSMSGIMVGCNGRWQHSSLDRSVDVQQIFSLDMLVSVCSCVHNLHVGDVRHG